MEYTSNPSLLKNPKYHKIRDYVNSLEKSSHANSFSGNCVATCDILQTLLAQIGIPSKIMECQVSVVREINGDKIYNFVGYDNYSYQGQIDTHTVIVTDDENPILIDMSIAHLLPENQKYVIEYLEKKPPLKESKFDKNTLGDFKYGDCSVTYMEKSSIRLPSVHQKNLLQRIVSEQNLEKRMDILKYLVIGSVTLGLVNFSLNVILIVLRLFNIVIPGYN